MHVVLYTFVCFLVFTLFLHYILIFFFFFFFNATATTEIYTLSLHDALPICIAARAASIVDFYRRALGTVLFNDEAFFDRSEEHTSELQSHSDLVCRLLLEKKKKKKN